MQQNLTRKFVLLRFGIVGIANTLADLTTFSLLILWHISVLPAQIVAYLAGMGSSFWLNRKWTFQINQKVQGVEIIKFLIVNGLSLLVSIGVLLLLVQANHVPLWIGKVISIGGGTVVNFMGSRLWVFRIKNKE